VRRILYWYLPAVAALVAASVFGYGLVSYLRGDTGTIVDIAPRPIQSTAARSKIVRSNFEIMTAVHDNRTRGKGRA